MAKYIVDLPDAYTSKSALFGDILSIPICLESGKRYGIPTGIKLEPYTEPDGVKNNKVNLCDSCNYIYPECPSERYDVMFGDGVGKDNICCCAGYRAINEQEIRQKVEDEVWEFVDDAFWSMTQEDIGECYDGWFPESYQEAKAKYEAWLKKKDEICVGDEVIPLDTQYDTMVVTKLWVSEYDDEWVDTIAGDGKTYNFLKTSIKKTGRHFDSVEKLLEEMREETE